LLYLYRKPEKTRNKKQLVTLPSAKAIALGKVTIHGLLEIIFADALGKGSNFAECQLPDTRQKFKYLPSATRQHSSNFEFWPSVFPFGTPQNRRHRPKKGTQQSPLRRHKVYRVGFAECNRAFAKCF